MTALTAASTCGLSFGTTMFCGTLKKLSDKNRKPGKLRNKVASR